LLTDFLLCLSQAKKPNKNHHQQYMQSSIMEDSASSNSTGISSPIKDDVTDYKVAYFALKKSYDELKQRYFNLIDVKLSSIDEANIRSEIEARKSVGAIMDTPQVQKLFVLSQHQRDIFEMAKLYLPTTPLTSLTTLQCKESRVQEVKPESSLKLDTEKESKEEARVENAKESGCKDSHPYYTIV